MRVLRRRFGAMRYGGLDTPSDRDVRVHTQAPSVDCILMGRRLSYMVRVLVTGPPPLRALLHARVRGVSLPWVRQVIADMSHMNDLLSLHLPDPEREHAVWSEFIVQDPSRWRALVAQIFFTESFADRVVSGDAPAPVVTFPCPSCEGLTFPSPKSLAQHCRRVHGVRTPVRLYVSGSVCPVCRSDFRDRLRCIAHLTDSRRPRCRTSLLGGDYPALPLDRAAELDEADKVARRAAWRSGHTHALADLPATSVSGKPFGRCTRSSR